jgi:hypothetical protein
MRRQTAGMWRRVSRVLTSLRQLPGRISAFLRWLMAADALPGGAVKSGERTSSERRFTAWLLAGEKLARETGAENQHARRPGFLRRVFSQEPLPDLCGTIARPLARRRGFLTWILSSEECPRRESIPRRATRFVEFVFASEVCPTVEAPTSKSCVGFVQWLFTREDL